MKGVAVCLGVVSLLFGASPAQPGLAALDAPGGLPGQGRLTFEPGGQVELSSAPAASLGDCVAAASRDLAALRQALRPAGLTLVGRGFDPCRPARRVLDLPGDHVARQHARASTRRARQHRPE